MLPFPLLRLPVLVLSDVLKCLNPIELFIFTRCSQKATKLITLSNSKTFMLSCVGHVKVVINQKYVFEIISQLQNRLNFCCQTGGFTSFWCIPTNEKKELSFYLADLYNCPIAVLEIDPCSDLEWFHRFVQEIPENLKAIRKLSISTDRITSIPDEGFKNLLESSKKLNITDKMYVKMSLIDNFEFIFDKLPKNVIIDYSKWFSKSNLLSIDNCELVKLYDSELTNNDLDEFLKLWKSGKYSNLKFLSVTGKLLTNNMPIAGVSKLFNASNKMCRSKKIGNKTVTTVGGVEIVRDDGTKAEMCIDTEPQKFTLFVLEDSDTVRKLDGR